MKVSENIKRTLGKQFGSATWLQQFRRDTAPMSYTIHRQVWNKKSACHVLFQKMKKSPLPDSKSSVSNRPRKISKFSKKKKSFCLVTFSIREGHYNLKSIIFTYFDKTLDMTLDGLQKLLIFKSAVAEAGGVL